MSFQPLATGINTSGNVLSSINSSTTILAANATFTGTFENVLQYQEISCFCVSDVSGTLYLDISADGLTILVSFPFVSTGNTFFRSPLPQSYIRIRYVNGATLQTQFSLTTLYRPIAGSVAQVPFNTAIFDVSLAQNERAVLFGKNSGGNYTAVGTDVTDGGLDAHVTNFPIGQTIMSASIPVVIASDQSVIPATLGNSTNKTVVMKTGSLVTTATTVDQVILTRTVTTGKTFYLQYFEVTGRQTSPAGGTAVVIGTISLELPSGTKVISNSFVGGGAITPDRSCYYFSEPIPVTSANVIRVVVTPISSSSFTWFANFGGYEK